MIEHFRVANEALVEAGVTYWASCGTLLGIIREGDFLAHDSDIDFSTPDWKSHEAVAEAFEKRGYAMESLGLPDHGYEQCFFSEGAHILDVFYLYEETWQGSYTDTELLVSCFPAGIFLPPTPYVFQGIPTFLPAQPEKVLEARYGDWRTPVKTWDYSKDPKCLVET